MGRGGAGRTFQGCCSKNNCRNEKKLGKWKLTILLSQMRRQGEGETAKRPARGRISGLQGATKARGTEIVEGEKISEGGFQRWANAGIGRPVREGRQRSRRAARGIRSEILMPLPLDKRRYYKSGGTSSSGSQKRSSRLKDGNTSLGEEKKRVENRQKAWTGCKREKAGLNIETRPYARGRKEKC